MLVQAWASSGLSQKDFCKSEKINLNTFRYWVGKAKRSKKEDLTSESAFIPVSPSANSQSGSALISIFYANGVEVRLPSAADWTILQRLIQLQ